MTTPNRKTRTRTRSRSRSRTKNQQSSSSKKSFTPELNKHLDTTITRTRRRDVFSCKDDHVKVKVRRRTIRKRKTMSNGRRRKTRRSKSKSKFYQCLPLGDSRTKKQLQRLLNR